MMYLRKAYTLKLFKKTKNNDNDYNCRWRFNQNQLVPIR